MRGKPNASSSSSFSAAANDSTTTTTTDDDDDDNAAAAAADVISSRITVQVITSDNGLSLSLEAEVKCGTLLLNNNTTAWREPRSVSGMNQSFLEQHQSFALTRGCSTEVVISA